mmetsp:Transcript_10632/g.20167  ORF Transcript_10632/g.20167 Transcript_10632/m.20167 type:complete len:355 (+) Transcript_10632:23-1087(+)
MGCCCGGGKAAREDVYKYETEKMCSIIFRCKGSVIPKVLFRSFLSMCAGITALVLWYWHVKEQRHKHFYFDTNSDAHVYVGMLISLLQVFRTNASYAQYDKGITAVLVMRNNLLNFVSQSTALVHGDPETCEEIRNDMARLCTLLFVVVKKYLHDEESHSVKQSLFRGKEEQLLYSASVQSRPGIVISWLRQRVAKGVADGYIVGGPQAGAMDANLTSVWNNLVSCMRIKEYHMPFPYAQMVKFAVCVFVFIAPFSYVSDVQFATPLVNFVIGLILFGVDEIGVEIEDPFGKDPNDLRIKPLIVEMEEEMAQIFTTCHQHPYKLLYSPTWGVPDEEEDDKDQEASNTTPLLGKE